MAGNKEVTIKRVDGKIEITHEVLGAINVSQMRNENKDNLVALGGVENLVISLGLDTSSGLTEDQVTIAREKFSDNAFPDMPITSYLSLLYAAMTDTTLLILMGAAAISLLIGIQTDPDIGWIEGTSILIAVFIISNITAGNDYSKLLQFRELEKATARVDLTNVFRFNKAINKGQKTAINPKDIVVGDIVVLQAGDAIPADCILLHMDSPILRSNEAGLTGEPNDLKKTIKNDCFLLSSCLVTDGECRALVIGTGLHSQWGKIKTSLEKQQGPTPLQEKLAVMTTRIGYCGMFFAIITFIASFINIWAKAAVGGPSKEEISEGIVTAFILSVTIVVVAIPEGLPLAVTIALAYSMNKMFEEQCEVRRMQACEIMGNATNLCSDKTGTLTENKMTVVEGWFGNKYHNQKAFKTAGGSLSKSVRSLVAEQACINRSAFIDHNVKENRDNVIGNKTEGALIFMAREWGYNEDEVKETYFRPEESNDCIFVFDSVKKRSTAVLFNHLQLQQGAVRVYSKGASETLLKDCGRYLDVDGSEKIMDEVKMNELLEIITQMSRNALRTLMLAHRDFSSVDELSPDWRVKPPDSGRQPLHSAKQEDGVLCCDCIVGIMDPLRDDVVKSVRIAQRAGITVRMVTGDNIDTAKAIGKQCGIYHEESGGVAIEGPIFRNMTPAQADAILPNLEIMARSSPHDKFLLVTRLNGYGLPRNKGEWEKSHPGFLWEQHRDIILPGYEDEWLANRRGCTGQVVGVTGDGTNDAPALMAADVGLAMGLTGTKVAQGAADIIIRDDKFGSMITAIKWGRSVYDNIRKFLQFQLTVNIVALLLVFVGACVHFGMQPLNAVQMLWVNLIMDTMGALALATEPPTDVLLQRKPYKRDANLISRPMIRNIALSTVYQLAVLFMLLFAGPKFFGIREGDSCFRYEYHTEGDHYTNAAYWDPNSNEESTSLSPLTSIRCVDFPSYCPNWDRTCYEAEHIFQPNNETNIPFQFTNLHNYDEVCLKCKSFDFTHGTIIFNAFIFCTLFNEFSSRFLGDEEWNPFKGIWNNHAFLGVIVVTVAIQIILVEFAGIYLHTSPLSLFQWIITILIGFVGLLWSTLGRLYIKIEEDPNSFFDNHRLFTNLTSPTSADITLHEHKSGIMLNADHDW